MPQTDNDAEDSWTSNRSSVNDLKEAHLVRELTPLVESLAKGESKDLSPPLSKIPATIMSETLHTHTHTHTLTDTDTHSLSLSLSPSLTHTCTRTHKGGV